MLDHLTANPRFLYRCHGIQESPKMGAHISEAAQRRENDEGLMIPCSKKHTKMKIAENSNGLDLIREPMRPLTTADFRAFAS